MPRKSGLHRRPIMEGVTILPPTHTRNVNCKLIYEEMYNLSVNHKLLNPKVTNYLTLECLTSDIVLDGCRRNREYMDVVFDLLDLWFPALTDSFGSWSGCLDLDIEVESFLRRAGYPCVDGNSGAEDVIDLPD